MTNEAEPDVLVKLEEKFKQNLLICLQLERELYARADIKARAFAVLGQIISEDPTLSRSQKEIVQIFDEVFSDVVLSLHFSACALNRPAESVLRRALELGIAIVYLWDLPHAFWGWKAHDIDLNFNEMVEHLKGESYRTYLASLDSTYINEPLFDEKDARQLYRILSNTIHGKIISHTAYLPNRFAHDPAAWRQHLNLVEKTLTVLIKLSSKRFFAYYPELTKRMPALLTA